MPGLIGAGPGDRRRGRIRSCRRAWRHQLASQRAAIDSGLGHPGDRDRRGDEAVGESSADAIRLRRALDTLPQGVIVCDDQGEVVFRNARAAGLMGGRHGDALAAQAVVDLLSTAWQQGAAERTLDLYGPPRRTLEVRTKLIDDGRRTLGVIAVIDDVSERRRLEEVRRDFVANVSHELKTPMGALGLLAETLLAEDDPQVAQRLARRLCVHCREPYEPTEADIVGAGWRPEEVFVGGRTPVLYRAAGCSACAKTGYRGRKALLELLVVSEEIERLIVEGGSADDIHRLAVEQGMVTLRQSGLRKAIDGETTLEEVLRVVA